MRLGEILIEADVITPEQLADALERQKRFGGRLGTNLLERGFVNEAELGRALSQQSRVPAVSRAVLASLPRSVIDLIPAQTAAKYRVCPVRLDGARLHVATATPSDRMALARVAEQTGCEVRAMVTPELVLGLALEMHYGVQQRPRVISVVGHEDSLDARTERAAYRRITEEHTAGSGSGRVVTAEQPTVVRAPAPRPRSTIEFAVLQPTPPRVVTVEAGKQSLPSPAPAPTPQAPQAMPAAPVAAPPELRSMPTIAAEVAPAPPPPAPALATQQQAGPPSVAAVALPKSDELTPVPEIPDLAELATRFVSATRQADVTEGVLGYLHRHFGTVVMLLLRGNDQLAGRRAVGRVSGAEVRAWAAPRESVPVLAQAAEDSPPQVLRNAAPLLGRLSELIGVAGPAPCLVLPMRCGGRSVGFFVGIEGSETAETHFHELSSVMTKLDLALQMLVLRQHILEQD